MTGGLALLTEGKEKSWDVFGCWDLGWDVCSNGDMAAAVVVVGVENVFSDTAAVDNGTAHR